MAHMDFEQVKREFEKIKLQKEMIELLKSLDKNIKELKEGLKKEKSVFDKITFDSLALGTEHVISKFKTSNKLIYTCESCKRQSYITSICGCVNCNYCNHEQKCYQHLTGDWKTYNEGELFIFDCGCVINKDYGGEYISLCKKHRPKQ